jgi:cytidyltransferase-like protein
MKKAIKTKKSPKKVFVSGCFDLVHSGHVEFFKRAARYGDLYVSIGSDKTYREYKHKDPIYNEEERKFIIENLRCVKKAFIARPKGKLGPGVLDFAVELKKIKPNYFVVGDDSNVTPEKRALVESMGAKFIVIKRAVFKKNIRSTTALRTSLS